VTSEDYARLCLRRLRESLPGEGDEKYDDPGYNRLSVMLITRIMGAGADEYEIDSDTQRAEVKPLADLVVDMEEEIADLVAYAAMFGERSHLETRPLISMAVTAMTIIQHMKEELE
jgi:hypothetical protein